MRYVIVIHAWSLKCLSTVPPDEGEVELFPADAIKTTARSVTLCEDSRAVAKVIKTAKVDLREEFTVFEVVDGHPQQRSVGRITADDVEVF